MSYPLINGAVINGEDGAATGAEGIDLVAAGQVIASVRAQPSGVAALDLGAPRGQQGVDVALAPAGIELTRYGVHTAYLEQPPSNMMAQVTGASALELGTPALVVGGLIARVASAVPMEMGAPNAQSMHAAAGYVALQTGQPGVQAAARVPQASALSLGTPSMAVRLATSGIDLSVHMPGRARAGGLMFAVDGHEALELGVPGTAGITALARQSVAFTLGTPSVDRGALC